VNESLMRLRKRRTGRMVSIDEDIETDEGSVRATGRLGAGPEQNYGQAELAEILRKTSRGSAGVSYRVRAAGCGRTFDRRDGRDAGLSVPAVKSRLLRARLQLRGV